MTGEEVLRRFKAGGEDLRKQPILLGGGLALLTDEERRELLAPALELEYVGAAATRALGRLLPKASCGVVDLLVVACTMFDPEPRDKWEKMLARPLWREILGGDANRATRRKMRRLVRIVRKMAKGSYRKKSFEASDREVEFWVVAHKDHKGNLGKAWEAQKGEKPFDSYASMLEAMHPLNLAFGITVRRGRPSEELGPELKDFPIEPDRIGAWYEKKGRGENPG